MSGLDPTYPTGNYFSINGHGSSLASILYGVLQGSDPGPLSYLK